MPVVHPVAHWTATEFAQLRAEVEAGNVRAVVTTSSRFG